MTDCDVKNIPADSVRICQNCKNSFVIEPEDFQFYEKMKVPPPTFCPACRMIRRFVCWNYRKLFRRQESVEGKEIFSWFHKDAPVKVYDRDYWWSDKWDPLQYARGYDFSRPFFEQIRELMLQIPWPGTSALNIQNSPYVNNCSGVKDSYLCFSGLGIENSAYVVFFTEVKDSFDLFESRHSELCYDSYMVDEAYRVFFSVNCEESADIWFSRNLQGCSNCFACVNLRNKKYHIFNKPYTKEAYSEFIKGFNSGSYKSLKEMKQKAHEFWLKFPMRFTLAINVVNSTGEHIERTKNVHQGYSVHESENVKYSQFIENMTDSYDVTRRGTPASLCYESAVVGLGAERILFSTFCFNGCNDLEYCMYCPGSSNLFGCVGLNKKQYCILNKQYSKEDYFVLREKIIKHMNEMPFVDKKGRVYKYGEFFPVEFSPFAYNETLAQDFFPLTKEQAEEKGYLWREPDRKEFGTTIDSGDLPDNIKDVSDDILKEIIKCEICKRAYRIIEMEFAFLKRIGLPLPRLCYNCRFQERFKFVNPPRFWRRKCQCAGEGDDKGIYKNTASHPSHAANEHCPNEFETSYAPNRPEIVYCEQCYQEEVL